jgi:hypothetical protein
MKITKKILADAAAEQIITDAQAHALYDYFKTLPTTKPLFTVTHVLYYFGGLIAIGAMTLFMTLGWEAFGGWGIVFITLLYGAVALKLTTLFQAKGYVIPAGITATFVVALTPLAIYGLQQGLGVWPDETVYRDYHRYIKWHWLYMELGTLLVGAVMIWRYRYPFLVMPVAVTLWYMSMDIAAMLVGGHADFELRALVSLYCGLLITLLAFWVDFRSHQQADYAFWLYLVGVLTFWGGLSSQSSDSELSRLLYCCINIAMIGIGVIIMRRVFVVFGAFGVCGYLGHLAWHVFEDSWFFPVALTLFGLAIIYLGILWQQYEQKITIQIRGWLPMPLQEFLAAKTVSD